MPVRSIVTEVKRVSLVANAFQAGISEHVTLTNRALVTHLKPQHELNKWTQRCRAELPQFGMCELLKGTAVG